MAQAAGVLVDACEGELQALYRPMSQGVGEHGDIFAMTQMLRIGTLEQKVTPEHAGAMADGYGLVQQVGRQPLGNTFRNLRGRVFALAAVRLYRYMAGQP